MKGFVAFSLLVLFVGLITNKVRPSLLFGGLACCYYFLGFLDLNSWLSSYKNPSLITLVLLLLVSPALEKTMLVKEISALMIRPSYQCTLFRLGVVVMGLSAFLNNTALVATLMAAIKNNPYHFPSKLLIPLSYFAVVGGTLTLIGTSTNLIVNSFVIEEGLESLLMFDFLPVGACLCVAVFLVMFPLSSFLPAYKRDLKGAKQKNSQKIFLKKIQKNALRALPDSFAQEKIIALNTLKSLFVVVGFIVVILGASFGTFSLLQALFVFLLALLALRILNVSEVIRNFPFGLWVIIGSSLAMTKVLIASGLAQDFADLMIGSFGRFGVYGSFVGIYLLVLLLTEIMTNNAAAALTFPIAYATAVELGVSPYPFIFAVAYGASGGFMMPFGYQTHLMVSAVCNYQLRDFLRVGWVVSLVYSSVVLFVIPLVFNF